MEALATPEPLFEDESSFTEAELSGETATAEAEPAPEKEPEARQDGQDWLDPDHYAPVPDGPPDPWKSFRVLSDREFEELKDDDPEEAIAYLRRENQYKEHHQRQTAERETTRTLEDQILRDAWKGIEEVIPNALDRDRPEVQEAIAGLTHAAKDAGFTDRQLSILSNPATRVVVKGPDGKDRVVLLGTAAAAVVRLISKLPKTAKPAGRPSPKPAKASSKPAPGPRRHSEYEPLFADEATFSEDELRGV